MDFEKYIVDLNAKGVCRCMDGRPIQKIYRFPNDYGALVLPGPEGAGPELRVYVLRYETPAPENRYSIMTNTSLAAKFLECADWDEVEAQLRKVCELPPAKFITLG